MMRDTHVHVYPPEIIRNWEHIAEREEHFAQLARSKVHRWATVDDVVGTMKTSGISESWIFGFAFADQGLCRLCNDYVLEGIRRFPDLLRGLAVVSPTHTGCENEIFRCREAGMIGIGELFPQGQGFDLTDMRQTWRLASVAHETGMFLLFHSAEPVGHGYPGKGNVGPKEATVFCTNHPESVVVFAHFGGGLWQYELMPELRLILSNVWYDTAAFPWLYSAEILKTIRSAGVLKKLVFGSDFPILPYHRYASLWESACLEEEDLKRILSENASILLERLSRESSTVCTKK
jgi:predicted TIM-barrel fold metal-dependent hydrolase